METQPSCVTVEDKVQSSAITGAGVQAGKTALSYSEQPEGHTDLHKEGAPMNTQTHTHTHTCTEMLTNT